MRNFVEYIKDFKMSKKNDGASQLPDYPRAPPFYDYGNNLLAQRSAPPSYEESQQMQTIQPTTTYAQHGPVPVCAYPQSYTATVMNTQGYVPAPINGQLYMRSSQQLPVLELAKGAEMRITSTGAISIPPPPPGCAPTAGQLAAMQGKSVLVKEPKKRSFFS